MGLECSECERDYRGGHHPTCSRYVSPNKPMSETCHRVLKEIASGLGTHHQVHGMSAHGGRTKILLALMRRGLIDDDYHITDAGRKVL